MKQIIAPYPLCDFFSYMENIKGKSQKTIKEYFLDLKMFYKFLTIRYSLTNENNFNKIDINLITVEQLKRVTLSDLHAFIVYLDKERHNGGNTKARKVFSLKSYFKYLSEILKIINENPTENLEKPKIGKRLPVYLTLEESQRLLNIVSNKRDFAIIVLFLNCGMRLSELANINIDDVKEDTLIVNGKGDKERTIYLNSACINAVQDYLKIRPEVKNEKALFLSNRKQRISTKTIQSLVKKYLEKAGLDTTKYSTHKLRHTAATLMYQYGNTDIRALQEILGHESVSTTEIYTHVSNRQLQEAVNNNPLGKVNFGNKE